MRFAVVWILLIACGAPKRPIETSDLDVPRSAASAPESAPADAMEAMSIDAPPPADASIDARVVSAEAAACEEDPQARQACKSMGATFEPRMVMPCPYDPMKARSERCMCVDVSKPRDCKQ